MDLSIHVTDAAISLRRASKTEEMWTKTQCFILVFFIKKMKNRARKKRYIVRDFSKNTRTYEYCPSMEEQQKKTLPTVRELTNPTTCKNIFKLQRQNRGAQRTQSLFSTSLICTKHMLGREKAVRHVYFQGKCLIQLRHLRHQKVLKTNVLNYVLLEKKSPAAGFTPFMACLSRQALAQRSTACGTSTPLRKAKRRGTRNVRALAQLGQQLIYIQEFPADAAR